VTFSEASRTQGAYHRDEVDAFLHRVEATLRNPTAPGAVTVAELQNVAFSEPPIGRWGYAEGEVDLFLDRVKIELTHGVPGQRPQEPIRCVLYRYGGRDQQTPVLAIEVGKDAFRVVDLSSNALIASVSLAEVTAKPAQNGRIPVLVVDGAGLETLTIQPHPPPGEWRKTAKSQKPAYLAIDEEWLTLAERFGLASDLVDEYTPKNLRDQVLRYFEELRPHAPKTWRTPLGAGLIFGVPACIYGSPTVIAVAVVLLIVAALMWRFKWEF
jgi:DivIVA domain-containing protein